MHQKLTNTYQLLVEKQLKHGNQYNAVYLYVYTFVTNRVIMRNFYINRKQTFHKLACFINTPKVILHKVLEPC